jgi:hypothetical protein
VSDTPPNPLEGLLSNFALGPSWARAKSEPVEKKFKDAAEREFKPRGGGDRRDDPRGAGRSSRDDRGGRDDRRGGGGGGAGGRRDFNKGGRERPDFHREEILPTDGATVTLIPEKTAIQLIAKEIQHVARVYPLFDVAEIILAERSRSRAVFELSGKKDPFYRCKLEEAIFLTKEEALRHLLESPWRDRFIEESTIEVDPPKGNFQSVARCGISGEWLGPPNFHAYQTEIRRIHRERFSNMPFESYLAKIRTERSEEAVNAWLETKKTQTRWRILSDEESAAVATGATREAPPLTEESKSEPKATSPEETPANETAAEAALPESEDVTDSAEAPAETAEEPEATEAAEETIEAPAEPEPGSEIKWFTDRAEFERALIAEVLEKAYHITRKAKVSAAIPGKNLSPGLLARLKGTGNHHRKHPAILIPLVCKILEAEHMPVFKRKGKLFTGPARPHALAADAVLAPRPAEMVKWIRENPPAKLEGLWKAVLPEGATAPPAEYAADLFWLLQQGHILLYTDDTLVVQEAPKPQEPKKPKKPKEKKPTVAADSSLPAEAEPTPEQATSNSELAGEAPQQTSEESSAPEQASSAPEPEPAEVSSEQALEPTEAPSAPEEAPSEIQAAAPEPSETKENPTQAPLP